MLLAIKLFGNSYNFHKLKLSIYKRFYLSVLGYTVVTGKEQNIWQVPYPLLSITAPTKRTLPVGFVQLMNFLEFVSDQYTSINIDHCLTDFFFNKIPLMKKLKLARSSQL
jgi:hypothetical protein